MFKFLTHYSSSLIFHFHKSNFIDFTLELSLFHCIIFIFYFKVIPSFKVFKLSNDLFPLRNYFTLVKLQIDCNATILEAYSWLPLLEIILKPIPVNAIFSKL